MAIILSVSIEQKQKEFLDELKLSPSALLQRSINEMMAAQSVSKEYVNGLHNNIKRLQQTITKQGTFIDKNGLMQEYLNFEDV